MNRVQLSAEGFPYALAEIENGVAQGRSAVIAIERVHSRQYDRMHILAALLDEQYRNRTSAEQFPIIEMQQRQEAPRVMWFRDDHTGPDLKAPATITINR
jgi:hypothetical protein